MLRLTILALCLGLAAACSEPADSAIGLVVTGDDGEALGRVTSVERNADGRIVAAGIEGLEPADAPLDSEELLAQENEQFWVRTSASGTSHTSAFSALR